MKTQLKMAKRSERDAFTMIEVALAIAVVAFALVAILGVLPTGIRVQKDNREDTIVNQDGLFLLEAIRGGTRTLHELTNYVESITISNNVVGRAVREVTNFNNGEEIVGLLTTLKEPLSLNLKHWSPVAERTTVKARMRSVTGAAAERGKKDDDFGFRYQVQVETTPFFAVPPSQITTLVALSQSITNTVLGRQQAAEQANTLANMNASMFDVRLTLRWPVYQQGLNWRVGRNRKTFSTVMCGTLITNAIVATNRNDLTFVLPNTLANINSSTFLKSSASFLSPYVLP